MRCDCCNRNLNDYESTLRAENSGEYLNTCLKCLKGLNIKAIARGDLDADEEADDEYEYLTELDYDDEDVL